MNIKSFLRRWIFPPAMLDVMVTLEKHRKLNLQKQIHLNKKRELRGRCFILASGPSILRQDLTLLKGEDVIAVSHVHRHSDISIIKPKYHVLAPFHSPFKFEDAKKYFDDFRRAYSPDAVEIFLGNAPYEYSFERFLETTDLYNEFKFKKIDYSNSSQLDESNYNDLSVWDLDARPFECRTVIYSAIQIAWKFGYKEVYLLGCDHDYILNLERVGNHRFYSDSAGISDKEHLAGFDLEKWFYEYYMRWKQYRLMKTFLNGHGVSIYNATEGGMLDIFPRVKYENLFEKNY